MRAFGFGQPTGVDLPGESPGIVLHPNQYSGSSMGNLPIGQGEAVTPIQMATAYSAIANAGMMVRPHIVIGDPAPKHRVITARTATAVSRMLEGVLAPGGTGSEASGARLQAGRQDRHRPEARQAGRLLEEQVRGVLRGLRAGPQARACWWP